MARDGAPVRPRVLGCTPMRRRAQSSRPRTRTCTPMALTASPPHGRRRSPQRLQRPPRCRRLHQLQGFWARALGQLKGSPRHHHSGPRWCACLRRPYQCRRRLCEQRPSSRWRQKRPSCGQGRRCWNLRSRLANLLRRMRTLRRPRPQLRVIPPRASVPASPPTPAAGPVPPMLWAARFCRRWGPPVTTAVSVARAHSFGRCLGAATESSAHFATCATRGRRNVGKRRRGRHALAAWAALERASSRLRRACVVTYIKASFLISDGAAARPRMHATN